MKEKQHSQYGEQEMETAMALLEDVATQGYPLEYAFNPSEYIIPAALFNRICKFVNGEDL